MTEHKKTVLYQKHVNQGATIVEFGGFLMPLYYSSIANEHKAVRTNVGMFDVSHMGEILIKGPDTYKFINYLVTSNIKNVNKMQYAILLNNDGTVIDDLMIYAIDEQSIMLVVNASNTQKDFSHIKSLSDNFNVEIINKSEVIAEIAVQGPNSYNTLINLFPILPSSSMQWVKNENVIISRSGYTGEDGFEIYSDPETIISIWDQLIKMGVTPCGLGSRDTLRFESAMPLYGHEISDSINPLEAGLNFSIDFEKEDFIGKSALVEYQKNPKRKIVGIQLLERNVPRMGYPVYKDLNQIGYITTGYLSPSLNIPIALALIDINEANLDNIISVQIRDKFIPAKVRNKKFYKKNNKV